MDVITELNMTDYGSGVENYLIVARHSCNKIELIYLK